MRHPLAVFDAIPGQEEDNAQFLLSHNMAVRIRAGESCGKTIRIVLADNRRLEDMRSSCERFDKSKSGKTSSGSSARSQERRKRYENLVAIRLGGRWP